MWIRGNQKDFNLEGQVTGIGRQKKKITWDIFLKH